MVRLGEVRVGWARLGLVQLGLVKSSKATFPLQVHWRFLVMARAM